MIGGSPCTHWSIAKTKNREIEPSGLGWELFLNYKIARDKYQPDYFLYENNKSMSAAIRAQITEELGVEPVLINSALVSAQSRQRLYWVGRRDPITGHWEQVHIEQPEDRGILLRDILESSVAIGASGEKTYALKAQYYKSAPANFLNGGNHFPQTGVAEPVRIGTIESSAKNADFDSQQYRVYSPDGKSVTPCGQGGGVGAKTGLYAVPAGMAWRSRGDSSAFEMRDDQKSNSVTAAGHQSRLPIEAAAGRIVGRRINAEGHRDDYNESIERFQRFETNDNPQKTNCISTVEKDNMVAIPAEYYGLPIQLEVTAEDGKTYPVYEVRNGQIAIRGKQYPIKLADGFYIIRKLTVTECKRLQTVPESYVFPVSDTQARKMLGNGWTVDVIAHIMSHFEGLMAEPVEVLSMYDGMSCGHLALDKLGAHISRYYATEIDKYAIKTTQHNFPDTVQLGDAFQVRDDDWGTGIVDAEETERRGAV